MAGEKPFHFPSFIRWLILILVFLLGLYFVLPKFELMSEDYRFNKVTGKVEKYHQAVSIPMSQQQSP